MIKTSHKGYEIWFDKLNETWVCTELKMSGKSLAGLKERISAFSRVKYQPFSVFYRYCSEFYPAKVTSPSEHPAIYRISFNEGKEKRYTQAHNQDLFADSPENVALLEKRAKLLKQAGDLEERARALGEQLQRAKVSLVPVSVRGKGAKKDEKEESDGSEQ